MAGLVDTSAIVALERRGLLNNGDLSALPEGELAIASITVSQLLVGIHRTRSVDLRSRRERGVEWVIAQLPILPFGVAEARIHARLNAELMGRGQRIGDHDLIIAATALAHDYAVFTQNLREFQRVPGLTVHEVAW